MSFMYNPYPYDDPNAVNAIKVPDALRKAVVQGTKACAETLSSAVKAVVREKGKCVVAVDGYMTAPFETLVRLLARALSPIPVKTVSADTLYASPQTLRERLAPYLPEDRLMDPPLLYGRIYEEGYEGLMEENRIREIAADLEAYRKQGEGVILLWGNGCLIKALRGLTDLRAFVDVTQKRTVLNLKAGKAGNLGFPEAEPFNPTLRHSYYVDFEAAGALRGELIQTGALDFYLTGDREEDMQLLPFSAFLELCRTLVTYPFRCRPVYIEGVWGGFYVKHLRNLPQAMRNCAWVFDLIPLEVSIVADMDGLQVEMPYYCFVQTVGPELMGETCVKKFDGYFPIRFNYDDTYHASGNMSIQVHPDSDYVRSQNNELGRQDESYYIVVAGQGAKTYAGFQNNADVEEFIREAKRSETEGTPIDHDAYVHSTPSKPGMQFLIPGGTIHASGRNQVILEIGSLTVGSYTYKMYDYLRTDLDGNRRPIHSLHGENVLRRDFKADWVRENLIQAPRMVRETEDGKEIIVGEHELLYFSLRNLCFAKRMTDDTVDRFHVLVLVEGEQVLVRSLNDPTRFFRQRYLDMVVVPANFGPYEVINEGVGEIVMHKTMLREGYEHVKR